MGFESSLETLMHDFPKCLTKGVFSDSMIMKNFEISVLTGILDNRQRILINSYPAISW